MPLDEWSRIRSSASLIVAHDEANAFDAVVPPIVQTRSSPSPATPRWPRPIAAKRVARPIRAALNPTVRMFEEKLARAGGASRTRIGFASGMAAISSTVLGFVAPGDRIVCGQACLSRHAYRLLRDAAASAWSVDGRLCRWPRRRGRRTRPCPVQRCSISRARPAGMMETHDLCRARRAGARRRDVLTVIDNSWATPVFQRPIALGVDLVAAFGLQISRRPQRRGGAAWSPARSELHRQDRRTICPISAASCRRSMPGCCCAGLRTLPIRMKAHEAAAPDHRAAAGRHHAVVDASAIRRSAARSPAGSDRHVGAVLVRASQTASTSAPLPTRLELFKLGVSWGGHESSGRARRGRARHRRLRPNSAIDFGVPIRGRCVFTSASKESRRLWSDLAGRRSQPIAQRRNLRPGTEQDRGETMIRSLLIAACRHAGQLLAAHALADTTLKLVEVITSPERTETLKSDRRQTSRTPIPGVKVEIISLPWGQAFEKFADHGVGRRRSRTWSRCPTLAVALRQQRPCSRAWSPVSPSGNTPAS
mgnify:CR=1 FL=1